jgi:hypothetical protein
MPWSRKLITKMPMPWNLSKLPYSRIFFTTLPMLVYIKETGARRIILN